jgi:8-oxo-dGTP pyrophosphatase MutT (NUDIX family)
MDLSNATECTHAAVIALYESSSQCMILTKRSNHLRKHPGEVCFPGGQWDEVDEHFYATALRELHEELGVSAERVTLIKELSLEQTVLGSIIHPWYALIESLEPFKINDNEVASIIRIPLSLVQQRKNYLEVRVKRQSIHYKNCLFLGHEEFIWGATARIMKQLIE